MLHGFSDPFLVNAGLFLIGLPHFALDRRRLRFCSTTSHYATKKNNSPPHFLGCKRQSPTRVDQNPLFCYRLTWGIRGTTVTTGLDMMI